MKIRTLLMSLLLALPLAASAAADPHVAKADRSPFAEQRAAIEEVLAARLMHEEISAADHRDALAALDMIGALLARHRSVERMRGGDKARLFNAQERVNQILAGDAADSRLHCQYDRPVGSHRQTTVCISVAERNRIREGHAAFANRMGRPGPGAREQSSGGM